MASAQAQISHRISLNWGGCCFILAHLLDGLTFSIRYNLFIEAIDLSPLLLLLKTTSDDDEDEDRGD